MITIDEAIKDLTELRDGCGPEMQKYIDACNLGIEALKKIKGVRQGKEWVGISLLPGETEEMPK